MFENAVCALRFIRPSTKRSAKENAVNLAERSMALMYDCRASPLSNMCSGCAAIVFSAPLRLREFHPKLPAQDVSRAVQRLQRNIALLRVEKTVELGAACLHQRRHLVL